MTNESIQKAFEELEGQLTRTIAIALYDIERYAGMTYEDFCAEEHVESGTLAPTVREKKLGFARRDIEMAQENLELLTKLKEKYGTNQPQDDFIQIARRTLGVFNEEPSGAGDAEGAPAGPDTEAAPSVGDGNRDAERDSGTESGGGVGRHPDRGGETEGGAEAPRARGGRRQGVPNRARRVDAGKKRPKA